MEDLGSMLLALLIIYSVLIIFTILLLEKLYRSVLTKGTKIREIVDPGNVYLDNSGGHIESYFEFKIKNGKNITRGTSLYSMCKKGKKRLFLYNADKNEITAKIYTIVWQFFFFALSLINSAIVGIPFLIIAILIIVIIVVKYSKNYKKKYLKGSK